MQKTPFFIQINLNLLLWRYYLNNDLIIKKSDKNNSIVIINESGYCNKIHNILSDFKKFVKSSIVDENHPSVIIGAQDSNQFA